MKIDLENIEQFTIPYSEFIGKWIFTDENDNPASKEHQDQISILTKEAARFLWDVERNIVLFVPKSFLKI